MAIQRTFVQHAFDPSDWRQLEPYYKALIERQLPDADAFEQWLGDFSELSAVVSEYGARKRIDQACHTDDAEIEKAFLHFIENIAPKLKPMHFELQKKYLAFVDSHDVPERYDVLTREWRADVELFREKNVPLQTQTAKRVSEYDKTIGAMVVEFEGKQYTLQQLARFLEEPDRSTREAAWKLSVQRRLEDKDKIESQFDELLTLRQQIAHNADLPDYRAYSWKALGRFDYQPQDCLDFADAIEQVCVPLVEKLDRQRRESLGFEKLRPWDLAVDVKGREPLRPYEAEQPEALVKGVLDIFGRLSPELASDFASLEFERNLDLESRRGKRAGGFQSSLEESGEPFIFMNAAGLQRDVETLLHEGGHAFHFIWASRREPLVFMRHAPMEFCEVASMAMELMGAHHLDVFYRDEQALGRARRAMLEGIVRFFPWMAIIDSFQHWLYTHPEHTPEQRREQWLSLLARFTSSEVDWSGFEDAKAFMWHRQLHLFHHPFYYVEYGIAQLGALQLWANFQKDADEALEAYRRSLTLGGTCSLPELFEHAGLRFDFSRSTIEPLMQRLWQEIERLPV